jgi:AAA+ ATPase superfamily predicted ATPase
VVESAWLRDSSRLGRRRVGKSQLLRHWALDKHSVVHVARNRAPAEELAALSQAVATIVLGTRRDLIARPFHDWDDAFDFLAAASASEPLLIVIDEFPELLKSSPTLESALRAIWERIDGTCQPRLILCGSAVRVMEALQTQDAPLFNRMTLRLQVNPFRPSEMAKMLPAASPLERAAAWGVRGGMPFYLSAWDENLKFRDNIAKLFCNEHALLLSEGEFVLATEGYSRRASRSVAGAGTARHLGRQHKFQRNQVANQHVAAANAGRFRATALDCSSSASDREAVDKTKLLPHR